MKKAMWDYSEWLKNAPDEEKQKYITDIGKIILTLNNRIERLKNRQKEISDSMKPTASQ